MLPGWASWPAVSLQVGILSASPQGLTTSVVGGQARIPTPAHRLGFHAYDDLEDEPDRLVSYCIWCHKPFVIRATRKKEEEQPYNGPMYTA